LAGIYISCECSRHFEFLTSPVPRFFVWFDS
jgi:hypothetical protein